MIPTSSIPMRVIANGNVAYATVDANVRQNKTFNAGSCYRANQADPRSNRPRQYGVAIFFNICGRNDRTKRGLVLSRLQEIGLCINVIRTCVYIR